MGTEKLTKQKAEKASQMGSNFSAEQNLRIKELIKDYTPSIMTVSCIGGIHDDCWQSWCECECHQHDQAAAVTQREPVDEMIQRIQQSWAVNMDRGIEQLKKARDKRESESQDAHTVKCEHCGKMTKIP